MQAANEARRYPNGLEVQEVDQGLLVRQGGDGYIARNWELSTATEELIQAAIEAGLGCMIRADHPRCNARWPNPRGVVYLAFSPDPTKQWSLAIDTYCPKWRDYGAAVFNGKYHAQFVDADIPFSFERRNKGAGHFVVARNDVIPTIRVLSNFDHSILTLNRATHDGEGFTTEYVLQRQILTNWEQTPWAKRYDVVQDEFPVDGGHTSRRIDILARDRQTGDWLIIELKRAEASTEAVHQVTSYRMALAQRDDFAFGRLDCALVAERSSLSAREVTGSEGVAVYEAEWPLTFRRVA